ncbi:MAG: glycosyltransferase family 2 protein [Candidatus Aenigmarchaeota archaeon]|nr:glycosyltransferase family 2 protein [Candidatus Aenigmarchaeota archaeon]
MKKKVAVVVPACQEEVYIGKCLDSISSQTMNLSEVGCVIIENGSSDDTLRIVENYMSNYETVIEKRKFRMGASRARDLGSKMALEKFNPDLVVFCDADTVLSPDFLEIAYNTILGKHVGGVPRVIYDPSLCENRLEYYDVKMQETINNLFSMWYHNVLPFPFPGYSPVLLADSDYIKTRFGERGYLFNQHVEMGEELVFQKELVNYGETIFLNDATATTSTRRWKKQGGFKVFLRGVIGQFYKGQKWRVEDRL